ncbi:MAG: DUF3592 domain-containing protein [Leisingera sp.]
MGALLAFGNFVRVLFLEGMLHRTAGGEQLGLFSRRSWGANLMFAGITGCLIGLFWFAQRVHFELDAVAATSEVLEVRRDLTSDGKAVFELTLRWTDQNGVERVIVPRVKASSYNVPLGTELNIKYNPKDPSDVRVETKEGPWYIPSLILIGSAMSFLMGRFARGKV